MKIEHGRNTDGKEIAKWMEEEASNLGLAILPKFKSKAIARYMDTHTLKDGHLVAVYAVQESGLYRDWVPVNTRFFGNTGRCTTIACMNKERMVKSIMKYKDGKRVKSDSSKIIHNFYKRYMNMVKTGNSGRDFVKRVFEEELKINLTDNWTIEEINKACKKIVENQSTGYTYTNYDEDYMGYPSGPKPHYETF